MRALALGLALPAAACSERPATLDLPAVVRGAQEVAIDAESGRLTPVVYGAGREIGLCLEVPATLDTSRWAARLSFARKRAAEGFEPPAARAGRTLCFDAPIPETTPEETEIELCAEIVDRFDGRRFRPPCRSLRFFADAAPYTSFLDAMRRLLGERQELGFDVFLRRIDALGERARGAGMPLFESRLELIAVHFLTREGTPEAMAEASHRLAAMPAGTNRPEVSYRGGQIALQRGIFLLAQDRPAAAWLAFEEAQERFRRIADENLVAVAMRQAETLGRSGSLREAIGVLRGVIADCVYLSCPEEKAGQARLQLAWFVLLDPGAGPAELDEARGLLEAGLGRFSAADEPLERSNQLINRAYLEVRSGGDPTLWLAEARELLGRADRGEERRRLLAGWADLVDALDALAGSERRALELCRGLGSRAPHPRLAAWAASCEGRALRAVGRLADADRAFAEALAWHERGDPRETGWSLALGPGQRADDFARAARVAAELGEAARAWRLLARLDALSAAESERRRCRERVREPELVARWRSIDAEIEGLLGELAELERPASFERQREAEALRRALGQRLAELWRERPGCAATAELDDRGLDLRAVALDDEILLLRRGRSGETRVERRTPFGRAELRRLLGEIADGRQRHLGDDAWARLTAPLAAALVPEEPGEVVQFALHGLLQDVPLAALPLPGGGWLADRTVVVRRPAAARAADGGGAPAPPLVVVDPRGDLPGAKSLEPLYRELFPPARVLVGEAATRSAVTGGLALARWLHVDAHGRYEAAFPELSGLELADGRLSFVEFAGLEIPARFANLSGCRTGSWPTTADSGRYGLGGLLVRLGVEWVVASRIDLPDSLASDYNREFYRAIAAGLSVPAAHGRALAEVRRHHPPGAWSGLMLLGGARG